MVVWADIWNMLIKYHTKEGKTVYVTRLETAREYASDNGFRGIRVSFHSFKKRERVPCLKKRKRSPKKK